MLHRAAVIAAGLAMTASVGLAGTGAASAASAGQHIKPGAKWTMEIDVNSFGCEVETFHANGTFTADKLGDSGTWNGGGRTIGMLWKAGADTFGNFNATFTRTPVSEYSGPFGGTLGGRGQLVKGVVASWNGVAC